MVNIYLKIEDRRVLALSIPVCSGLVLVHFQCHKCCRCWGTVMLGCRCTSELLVTQSATKYVPNLVAVATQPWTGEFWGLLQSCSRVQTWSTFIWKLKTDKSLHSPSHSVTLRGSPFAPSNGFDSLHSLFVGSVEISLRRPMVPLLTTPLSHLLVILTKITIILRRVTSMALRLSLTTDSMFSYRYRWLSYHWP